MKFYYEATAENFCDGEVQFPCFYNQELEKKDVVVVEHHGQFITAIIKSSTDELTVLLGNHDPKEILVKVETKEYSERKENKRKRLLLMNELEEKCKQVKMLETLKKYSDRDEEMKSMYESFEKLKS